MKGKILGYNEMRIEDTRENKSEINGVYRKRRSRLHQETGTFI